MNPSGPFLSLKNVTVRYFDETLFSELNFSVQKGEHWALVGESNSGVSQLLQAISGKFNVLGGQLRHAYFEEFLKENKPEDPYFTYHQLLALVTQKHHFRNLSNTSSFYYQQRFNSHDAEDAPTVRSYLAGIVPALGNKGYWNEKQVISTFKLEYLLGEQLIKLSNGETKRLLLAAALLKNPKLLLLDHPLTGLDVKTRGEFNEIITQITRSGITLIMATSAHEIPDAITHVAVLEERKIRESFLKENYAPPQPRPATTFRPNLPELKALMKQFPAGSYKTLVGMKGVSVEYDQKQILDNVNWQIMQGERWALLGPNGAGKSTLLSLINGDNPQAYANDIVLFDRQRGSGESIWDIKKKTGFVSPELYQYFPSAFSCLEIVESGIYDTLGLLRKSNPQYAALSLRWMALLSIEMEAEKDFQLVPASIQRIVLLARALVKNPTLLILDEPCQGLDQQQQERFKQLIESICAISNTSLIYVTHYQHEIPSSINKVLKLEKGKVVE